MRTDALRDSSEIRSRQARLASHAPAGGGCAIRVFLVVAGPLVGRVWSDDRASDGGNYPCERTAG